MVSFRLSIGRVLLSDPRTGRDVTVEDGTDSPANHSPSIRHGRSNLVDEGLQSVTSSLKVRAQLRSSYSRFQLHVNGETFSWHVGATLLELDGNVKSGSSQILAASLADYPERPKQAER